MPKHEGKLVAQNRKARHDYTIIDTIEAGMVLQGTEIKSIRGARINLKDGYARIYKDEIYLHNVHISPYEQGNQFNHDPLRIRKLLMHKKQIARLVNETKGTGITLVPLKVYIKNGYAKASHEYYCEKLPTYQSLEFQAKQQHLGIYLFIDVF